MIHPRQVTLVRHCEKPDDVKDIHLTIKGQMRALGLSNLLPNNHYDFIFACQNTKHSHRPYESILPTAKILDLDIDTSFEDAQFKELVAHIYTKKKYEDKSILCCWHHGMLGHLIKAFGGTSPFEHWPESVYDRIITLQYADNNTVITENHAQKLLYGDSEN